MDKLRLLKLREYLLINMGLNFTENRNKELYGKMENASGAFGFSEVDKFIDWLINRKIDNSQVEKLASFLTIGETYFQRERKALDFLEYEFLPKLIHERRGKHQYLKIWSAGCSSGEEPYSIAIMLKRLLSNIDDWNITLKATDINPNFLAKAKKGEYTEWSFRGIDDSFKKKYFKNTGKGSYEIKSDIKEMVDFSFLNLISDDYASPENNISSYDVILCRNVMIYFSNEGIRSVTSRFYDSLSKGGVLLLSPVESTHLICSKFNRTFKNSVTIYSKTDVKNDKALPFISLNNASSMSDRSCLFSGNNKTNKKVIPAVGKNSSSLMSGVRAKSNLNNNKTELQNRSSLDKIEGQKEISFEALLKAYKQGNTNYVEDSLKNIIENTKDLKKYLLLAKIYLDKMKLRLAEELCLKVIGKDKINAEAHYLLGNVYYEDDRAEEAIESLKKSVFLEPDNALSYYLLGNIYFSRGNGVDSERCFKIVNRILSELKGDNALSLYEDVTVQKLKETVETYLK